LGYSDLDLVGKTAIHREWAAHLGLVPGATSHEISVLQGSYPATGYPVSKMEGYGRPGGPMVSQRKYPASCGFSMSILRSLPRWFRNIDDWDFLYEDNETNHPRRFRVFANSLELVFDQLTCLFILAKSAKSHVFLVQSFKASSFAV
jgi:hypothetical protein